MADQFYLIAIAVFVAASFVIITWSRDKLRTSDATSLPGVRTAAIASVASCVVIGLVVFPLVWAWERALPSPQPDTPAIEAFLLPAAILMALVSLAVLDLYALSPPRPADRAGAARRGLLGPILVASGILVVSLVQTALSSASTADASAEERRAVEARSVGLSIVVTVVDFQLGESIENGRTVSHLTLDVAVRSATEIELRQTREGLVNQAIWFEPPDSPYVDVEGGLGLPGHIPAGFDRTYRLELPVVNTIPGTRPHKPGPWTAQLVLIGPNDEAGSPIQYAATTSVTVPDGP